MSSSLTPVCDDGQRGVTDYRCNDFGPLGALAIHYCANCAQPQLYGLRGHWESQSPTLEIVCSVSSHLNLSTRRLVPDLNLRSRRIISLPCPPMNRSKARIGSLCKPLLSCHCLGKAASSLRYCLKRRALDARVHLIKTRQDKLGTATG